jgi:hypothetical protein
MWGGDKRKRKELYVLISEKIGWKYHTANLRDIEEAREVYRIIINIKDCNLKTR